MSAGPEASAGASAWACRHDGRSGTYDERARRASHEELAVAKLLVSEGHDVRTVREAPGRRSPDLVACGVPVEVKSFQSLQERGGRAPSAAAVANKLLDASGQAPFAVVWAGESGLTASTAHAGYRVFRQVARARGLTPSMRARIVGKEFDLEFCARATLEAVGTPAPPHATSRAAVGVARARPLVP